MSTTQKTKSKKPERLVLLDAHAILHRAYHALPSFTSSRGEPTGALYGLSAMLIKIAGELKPDYMVACYDLAEPTFRHEVYEEYKATRVKTDNELISQIERSRDIFKAFNIPVYEKESYEADDLLGTIVEQTKKEQKEGKLEIVIASGDMDTMQLVDGKKVQVYTLKKGINDTILYDEKAVKERFGIGPKLLIDYKGLRGDPSDNIIGIKGIGEKTAVTLIQKFGTIEKIYKTLKKDEEVFTKAGITKRIINLLKEGEEEALFSKALATIHKEVPVSFSLPKVGWKEGISVSEIKKIFKDLSFRTLTMRALSFFGDEKEAVKEQKEPAGEEEIEKTALALWLVSSDITNPSYDDILQFAGEEDFEKAKNHIFAQLKKRKLEKVFSEIEEPIIPILKKAKKRGILVNKDMLKKLSRDYHKKLDASTKTIYKYAGDEFNINSSQQLSEVLFVKMNLPTKGLRKTPGGVISTRESELVKLRDEHPLIEEILAYREIQKLLSTYIDNVPEMLDETGALHPTLIQSGTTTGRMASADPNIQNIPVRGAYGKEIRSAFVARRGFLLASFDYSQIEFRILAILAKDKDLIRIFNKGKDFHEAVAAEVFGVSPEKVTKDMRRKAKVINFGILYGMGVTSLKRALGGSREEAQKFYDSYFDEFPGVASYIETIKREAHKKGYTETLFGRRRYVKGLSSSIPFIRAAAERMALNAPIQGSATGDIIKLAIKKVDDVLKEHAFDEDAFLLFQVHDELVYEIKKEKEEEIVPLIRKVMEKVVSASVPLVVDVSTGKNWGEL
ncbi:MAG: DNA polymerase [Candidatus Paceibacterota bacterium]